MRETSEAVSDGPTTPDSHVMTAPRPSTQRIGLLVLGMHRSGTSALTRLLSLLGAGLPKTLLGANPTNAAGHWEPKPIMDYHDRMLAELGSRWDDWRALDLDQLPESRRRELKDDLGQLIDEEFGSSELFVLKDPRVCRFVSLYRDVLSDKGIEPRYVIALRNPLAVVASLRQRDGMTDGFASLLWLRHVLDAEVATRDSPRAIATYESILADWRPALGTIGAKLALKWPRPLSSADDDVNAFLKRELQHYAPSRRELFARRDISSWVKDTYRALLALEQNADDEEAMQALDRVRTEFEAAAPVFGAAMFPELAARDARAAEAHRTEVVGLQASLRLRDSDIVGLRTEIAERDEQIGGLKTAAAELRSQTAARDEQIGRLSAAAAEVHKLRDEQSVLQRTLEANERELAAVRRELERSREEETLLRTTLQTSERELAAVRGELGESLNAREALQVSLEQSDAKVRELSRTIQESNEWRLAYENSTSWKVTQPLRRAATIAQRIKTAWGPRSTLLPTLHPFVESPAPRALPDQSTALEPKALLLSMVRNERDIIHDFCAHAAALFDQVVLIDHASTDGTREFIRTLVAADKRFDCYEFDEPGYYQSELMTWAARTLGGGEYDGWIFFLDADEFLPFRDRQEFKRKLREYDGVPIIELQWLNLIPKDIGEGKLFARSFHLPPAASPYHKIAFRPALIPLSEFIVAQGNHALLCGKNDRTRLPGHNAFPIYHVPIRSASQLKLKVSQGVSAYQSMGANRGKDQGFHWEAIQAALKESPATKGLIAGITMRYGQPLSPPYEVSDAELLQRGYREITLELAHSDLALGSGAEPADTTRRRLKINTETRLVQLSEESRFSEDDEAFLLDFVQDASRSIETLVPTTWGEHIPFMLCLVRSLRPSLMVELGTHHGASFFAACQALQQNGIHGKAYAIDLWKGDKHTGPYDETIFNDFKWLLSNRYSAVGNLLREDFTAASARFKDGTIDLLHIDGLHTYEAVKHDFVTWLPKVSARGVILFHDTVERRDDFGVWRLWAELSSKYRSFNFEHAHGLGVIALGDAADNPIARLASILSGNDQRRNAFLELFRIAGDRAVKRALS